MVSAEDCSVITLPDLTVPSQCGMFASLPDEYKIDSLLYNNISIFFFNQWHDMVVPDLFP